MYITPNRTLKHQKINEAIDDLRNWQLYQEKLKTWVKGNQRTIQ